MGNAASTAYEYAASFGRGSADAATSSWPNFERFFVLVLLSLFRENNFAITLF